MIWVEKGALLDKMVQKFLYKEVATEPRWNQVRNQALGFIWERVPGRGTWRAEALRQERAVVRTSRGRVWRGRGNEGNTGDGGWHGSGPRWTALGPRPREAQSAKQPARSPTDETPQRAWRGVVS